MIEHTTDFRRVKKVFDRPINIGGYYLIETVAGQDMGVWAFYPIDDGFEVHVEMLPECRGHKAAQSARQAFDWIWHHTDANSIYAAIPLEKKNVQVLANVVGFEFVFSNETDRCYKLVRVHNLDTAV